MIRQLITSNKIEKAIEEINLLDKKILKENTIIYFVLQRQRLLKYINENQLHEALKFAKDVLLPLTEGNDFLYKELEKTMCLLAYENLDDAAEKEMLTDKFLEKIASNINLVILNYISGGKMMNLNLELLIKLTMYVQGQLKNEMDFPQITTLSPLTFSNISK